MGENKFSPIVYESYYGGKQVFLTSVENIFFTSVENSFPHSLWKSGIPIKNWIWGEE